MNENRPELNWSSTDSTRNRLGIDESNLRHLKGLFVRYVLKRTRDCERDIQTVCLTSPDLAFLMLRRQHNSDVRSLEYFAKAEKSLEELAVHVDADGRREEQSADECPSDGTYEAALEVLRVSANDPLEPPTEQEKNAALEVLLAMYAERPPVQTPRQSRVVIDNALPF